MTPQTIRSRFAVLTLSVLTTACPPFDKPHQDDPDPGAVDGGSQDDGASPWIGGAGANRGTGAAGPSGKDGGIAGAGAGAASGWQPGGAAGAGDDPNGGAGPGRSAAGAGGTGSDNPFDDPGFGGGGNPFDPGAGGAGVGSDDPFGTEADGGVDGAGGRLIGVGSFGGAGGSDENAPPAARFAEWGGRWDGQMDYQFLVGVDHNILGYDSPIFETRQMRMALRIDAIDYDPSTSSATITARVAVGDCLLSAALNGSVFFGDALSPISNPILSLQAAGANSSGLFLALRANAKRTFNFIEGTINLQGVDKLPDPCGQKDLPFRLDRVFAK